MSIYEASGLDSGTHSVSDKMTTNSETEGSSSMLSTPTRKRKYKHIESPTTQLLRNMFETVTEFQAAVQNIYIMKKHSSDWSELEMLTTAAKFSSNNLNVLRGLLKTTIEEIKEANPNTDQSSDINSVVQLSSRDPPTKRKKKTVRSNEELWQKMNEVFSDFQVQVHMVCLKSCSIGDLAKLQKFLKATNRNIDVLIIASNLLEEIINDFKAVPSGSLNLSDNSKAVQSGSSNLSDKSEEGQCGSPNLSNKGEAVQSVSPNLSDKSEEGQSSFPNLSYKGEAVQRVSPNLSHASDDGPEFQQYLSQNYNLNFDVVAAYEKFKNTKHIVLDTHTHKHVPIFKQ